MTDMLRIAPAFEAAPELERALADHIVTTTYEDLAPETIAAARRTVLWFASTAIAGANAPGSAAIHEFARRTFGPGEATVLGLAQSGSAETAAFTNACFAKAHEWEDKFWLNESRGFAMGFAIGATALACAEEGRASGQRLIEAVAVAVDVQSRLMATAAGADSTGLGPGRTGWNATYLFSNYGATVAAAKVFGLDRDQVVDALGLAHAQAAGNFQGQMEGVLGIRLQSGFVVRNGIAAARLAALGISGARQFLSGRYGLYTLHFPAHDIDLTTLTAGLGVDQRSARLGFKGHPCGVVAHPVLDAALALDPLDPEKIDEIVVHGTHALHIMAEPAEAKRRPSNFIEAQFSLPWVVACAVADGALRLSHFEAETLVDDRLRSLADKVRVTMEREVPGVTVEVTLTDGTIVRSPTVTAAHGHHDNPVTQDQMVDVFGQCVEHAPWDISSEATKQALGNLLAIEDAPDVADVLTLLRTGAPRR